MNIAYFIFIAFEVLLLISFSRVTNSKSINVFSAVVLPHVASFTLVLFIDYEISSSYYLYIGLCHFVFWIFLCSFFLYYKITPPKSVMIRHRFFMVYLCLLIVYFIALYKQWSNASEIIGTSLVNSFTEEGQALENLFLLSGWAYLYRLNIPLLLFAEYYRITSKKNYILILEVILFVSTLLSFKKTEPILALSGILMLNYYLREIKLKTIGLYSVAIAVFPFFITVFLFSGKYNNGKSLTTNTIEYVTHYVSYQHVVLDYLIDNNVETEEEDNFQFITIPYQRLIGDDADVKRGSFIQVHNLVETNVYTYWGAYYTQFKWFSIIFAPLFLFFICFIAIKSENQILASYIFANLFLCFFGNMFEFLVFWTHFIYISLFYRFCIKKSRA